MEKKMDDDVLMNKVPLMEQFYTLQGEGFHAGRPAVFIRLAGCDVGCVWCDVKESWDEKAHPLVSINTILENVLNTGCKFVVITGGEPTLYNLSYLTTALKTNGIEIAIETSGTNPLRGEISWVTFSPKKFKAPLEDYYQFSDELKVVVYHPSDLKWAEEHAGKMKSNCRFYLQPEWSKMDELMPEILNYIKLNPKWNLSLQSHKFINIP